MGNKMRIKKGLRNLIYGLFYQAVSIVLSLGTRVLLVKTLGNDAISLNGLFTEVIAILSLAEMGVGSAIVYSLYVPLAQNDEQQLCKLMNLFKSAYRITASSVMVIGLILLPFIQYLINGADFDLNYLRTIYILFLLQTASSYLFSYKTSLLIADQRTHLISMAGLVMRIITFTINAAVLVLFHNYISYLIVVILSSLGNNVIISHIADKHYPFLKGKEKLSKEKRREIFANVKHIFIGKLSGKITNSTDSILISVLVGTLQIGAYSNYSLIINNVRTILEQFPTSVTGGIGQLVVTESKEKCHEVLCRMTFAMYMLGSVCGICIFCLVTPFISLMFGTEYVLSDIIVSSLVINFFYFIIKDPLWKMMEVTGLFSLDKKISIMGSSVNLVVSWLLGSKIGILGIMFGTTCTLLIQIGLKILLIYKKFFKLSMKKYGMLMIEFSIVFIAEMIIAYVLCYFLAVEQIYIQLGINLVIGLTVSIAVNCLFFYNADETKYFKSLLKMIFGKIKNKAENE